MLRETGFHCVDAYVVQAYVYYITYPRDSLHMKTLVRTPTQACSEQGFIWIWRVRLTGRRDLVSTIPLRPSASSPLALSWSGDSQPSTQDSVRPSPACFPSSTQAYLYTVAHTVYHYSVSIPSSPRDVEAVTWTAYVVGEKLLAADDPARW